MDFSHFLVEPQLFINKIDNLASFNSQLDIAQILLRESQLRDRPDQMRRSTQHALHIPWPTRSSCLPYSSIPHGVDWLTLLQPALKAKSCCTRFSKYHADGPKVAGSYILSISNLALTVHFTDATMGPERRKTLRGSHGASPSLQLFPPCQATDFLCSGQHSQMPRVPSVPWSISPYPSPVCSFCNLTFPNPYP